MYGDFLCEYYLLFRSLYGSSGIGLNEYFWFPYYSLSLYDSLGGYHKPPSLYRDWDSVDAILPTMTWSGDIVTVDNIRDHIWKTDTEFTLRYQKLSYDLNEIE